MAAFPQQTASDFVVRYWDESESIPKHVKLTQAFTRSIMEGYWSSGSRLPTEAQLVAATPCSLGTVQRALRDLASAGVITRRRGSGSVVADLNRPIEQPWHMRFHRRDDETKQTLPAYTHVIGRRMSQETGDWSAPLGQKDQDIIRIDRIFSINNDLRVYSTFYAIAERFPELADGDLEQLSGQNIKILIARHHQMPVHRIRQEIRFEIPPDHFTEHCDCVAGQLATVLNVIAYDLSGTPMYYQDFHMPPTNYLLDLGTTSLLG
uniref:GntR family transcriptional regulator n=1 Tax=Pararhizobium sp. IMCC3301 TaxID=3067904 RepID=UPI0027425317|nr:GntR family transcriptional regulator [Pararhizobium sp. IMCC3301]